MQAFLLDYYNPKGYNKTQEIVMKVSFQSTADQKLFNDSNNLRRKFGDEQAKLIRRRLSQLENANTLADLRTLPQVRCHELSNNRAGQLSVDVKHPYRLLFLPDHDPVPQKPGGGLDWNQVTAVLIVGIVDTHE
ncbi:MAG: type II toxin-antitoxin system RelE/ParE family toxin [Caldilineaceae bacterium]